MRPEAVHEFAAGVAVTLGATLLQTVDSSKRADLTAQDPVPAVRVPNQEAAAEGVPNTSGIDNVVFGNGGDEVFFPIRVQVRAILTARYHQDTDTPQNFGKAPT